MNNELLQGDIIKVEHIRFPVVIVSKDFLIRAGKLLDALFLPFLRVLFILR